MPLQNPLDSLSELATAVDDFLVASGAGAFVKKTKLEVSAILSPLLITAGQYTGDGTANRTIAHGLGRVPKLVKILAEASATVIRPLSQAFTLEGYMVFEWNTDPNFLAITDMTATNFYVGNATDYTKSANENLKTHWWVAIG